MSVTAAELADIMAQLVDSADWYVRCLVDVSNRRVVRGLDEAQAGYQDAIDRAVAALGKL